MRVVTLGGWAGSASGRGWARRRGDACDGRLREHQRLQRLERARGQVDHLMVAPAGGGDARAEGSEHGGGLLEVGAGSLDPVCRVAPLADREVRDERAEVVRYRHALELEVHVRLLDAVLEGVAPVEGHAELVEVEARLHCREKIEVPRDQRAPPALLLIIRH